jgi:hypothetical protein
LEFLGASIARTKQPFYWSLCFDAANIAEALMVISKLRFTDIFLGELHEEATDIHLEDFESSVGLGFYLYLSIVVNNQRLYLLPSALCLPFLLSECTLSLRAMLNNSKTASRGVRLLQHLLSLLPLASISLGGDQKEVESSYYYHLIEALIQFMVNCPVKFLRDEAFKVLRGGFCKVEETSRFFLLEVLVVKCPYNTISSLMLSQMKEETDKSWPKINSTVQNPFCGPQILNLLEQTIIPTNILERHDVIIAALNYYRYLLIRDQQTNFTTLWEENQTRRVKTRILKPLETEIKEQIETISSKNNQQQVLEQAQQYFGLPDISAEQLASMNASNILNLEVLQDTVHRVKELMAGESPFKGKPTNE